jgi:hypothetical protein
MEKIDRLGWAAGVTFSTYGLRAGVRVSDPAVLERVLEVLPPGWEPACSPFVDYLYSLKVGGADARRGVRHFTLLYFGLQRLFRTMDPAEALDMLEGHLQWQVAVNAHNRVLIHAGTVSWQGRAIILPGYSRAGKSTLVTELLKRGATYYSDEYAVLDGQGRVHPYARRLALRQEEGRSPSLRRTPEDFGSAAGTEPIPVGLVAVAKYRPRDRWRPRRLTSGQAVWELLNCTLSAQKQPDAALNVLQRAVAGAECVKGFRGEAAETAELLLQRLESTQTARLTATPTVEPLLAA